MKLETIPDEVPLIEALRQVFGSSRGDGIYRAIIGRVGEEPQSEIGHGLYGVVYLLPSGKALKVTSSVAELQAMQILHGVRHPNLVRVHDVFAVESGPRGVGVVLRDTVDEVLRTVLDEGQLNLLNIAKTNAALKYEALAHKGVGEVEALEAGMKAFCSYLRKWKTEPLFPGIVSGVEKLRKLGIIGIDFHEMNIGADDPGTSEARAVIFDMGAEEREDVDVAVLEIPR